MTIAVMSITLKLLAIWSAFFILIKFIAILDVISTWMTVYVSIRRWHIGKSRRGSSSISISEFSWIIMSHWESDFNTSMCALLLQLYMHYRYFLYDVQN